MIKVIEKSKIKTRPLSFKLNDSESADIFSQSLNYVPLVFISKVNDPNIKGTTIDARDIIYVKLHNSKFLPEIELCCEDSKGILFNDLYPYDHDTIISIFVKSSSENTMPIRMDFRVTEYETIKTSDTRNEFKYLINGILDVDNLHYSNYETRKGTTFDILKIIALEMKLGFASNTSASNDNMPWINPGITYLEFIKELTKYSFISEDSFVWTFIDFQYNLNYIDVQTELNEFIKDEQGTSTNPQITKNADEQNSSLYLTNNRAFLMTNSYISKFDLINRAFKVNLDKTYLMKGTWYNKNKNTVFKKVITELETDETKLQNSEGPLKSLIDKDSEIYRENVNDEYFIGKMNDNNVHDNYALASVFNKYNLDCLEKMKMIVTLTQINFSIKRFQNIKVEIYDPENIFYKDALHKKPLNNINPKLSGYWYVTGINYLYKRTGGVEQEITLIRRDLNTNYGVSSSEKNGMRKTI
jgi:hypothetical protein